MKDISKVGVLIILCCIVGLNTSPVELQNVHYKKIINDPEKLFAIVEVDAAVPREQKLSNRVPRQDDSDGDGDDGPVDPNNVPLTPDQLKGIGNNVVGVVTSALTGNVGGVVNGGLTLLNTRNRVNSLLATFGVTDKTVPPRNVTLSVNATTPITQTDDDDDDDDYPFAETAKHVKKSKTFYWF